MKRIIVTDIEWDAPKSIAKKLPKQIDIDIDPNDEYLVQMLEDVDFEAEMVSDYITNLTGWCHKGFCCEVVDVPDLDEPAR
jgi:hypothetical protein